MSRKKKTTKRLEEKRDSVGEGIKKKRKTSVSSNFPGRLGSSVGKMSSWSARRRGEEARPRCLPKGRWRNG